MQYFISDLHFHHQNVISYCRPQFSSIEQMNENIISNINKTVTQTDTLWILGDIILSTSSEKDVKNTLGRIICSNINIVLGNHDTAQKIEEYRKYCNKILGYYEDSRNGIIFSHYPVHPTQLEHRYKICVHGHLHNEVINDKRYINVSCEQINYTPISKEAILKKISKIL